MSLFEFCCTLELHLPPAWWLAGAAAAFRKGHVKMEG